MIYGNLICQDGLPEILRCIESVLPVVDEYLVMDGGSKDGTWEWLKKWKDVYNLTLFQHPYDDQGKQRNRLLKKTPKNVWVVNIDQDEELNQALQRELRHFIQYRIGRNMYSPKRILPLILPAQNINLVKDLNHFDLNKVLGFATKIFYNDRNLHFTTGYHMSIHYDDKDKNVNAVPTPKNWIIKHYAYLDQERIANSIKDPKRSYRKDEWNEKNWNIRKLPKDWK